jgi:multidrug efflux pump subunit AcrA (membrane-fusion protein)
MSLKKLSKLFLGIVIVGIVCFGLVVYENSYLASIGAHSVSVVLPTYNVGTEYNGVVTKQFVNLGSSVKSGQQMFEIKSDELSADLSSGTLTESNLTYKQATDGGFIITAGQAGVVTQLPALEGSFVNAGGSLATITATKGATIKADFELSSPQYSKVTPETPVQVSLGGSVFTATITGITQQSVDGSTQTIIAASLPSLGQTQTVYASGTPASAKLVLSNHTLYDRMVGYMQSHKSSIKI